MEPPTQLATVPGAPDKSSGTQTHSDSNPSQTAPDDNNTDEDQEESDEGFVDDEIIEFTDPLGDNEQTDAVNPNADTSDQGSDLQIK